MSDTPKTSSEILAAAMDVLARDIQSDDGVANAAVAEAAQCIRELERENAALRKEKAEFLSDYLKLGQLAEKEIKELRADKARLDWLEKSCTGASNSERYLPFHVYWGKVKTIRAAIDAALTGKEAKP